MPTPESPARARAIRRGRSRSTALRDSLAGRSSSMTHSMERNAVLISLDGAFADYFELPDMLINE